MEWIFQGFVFGCVFQAVLARRSFEIRLQESGNWSANEWIEFRGDIPRLKEFTSCHWEKRRYFSRRSDTIWAYCAIPIQRKHEFNCIQLSSERDLVSANRDVLYFLYSHGVGNDAGNLGIKVQSYEQRSWNHICWIYSTAQNANSLYYNGKLMSVEKGGASFPFVPGTDSADEYAFVIGQEPDSLRGGYTASQAYYGSIAEFNLWDIVINETTIKQMADGAYFPLGNVISWEKENFVIEGAPISSISDPVQFFKKKKQYIIFPQKQLLSIANETCASYGGSVVVPKSMKENEEVFKVLNEYRNECLDGIISKGESEMGAWLGMVKFEPDWFDFDDSSKITLLQYSNWTGSTWKKSSAGMCAYMNNDGLWVAESNEGCNFLQLCTICSLPRAPILHLKGLCKKGSQFERQYYSSIDSTHQIKEFEGFRRVHNISKDGKKWKGLSGEDNIIFQGTKNVVGRAEWDWFESSCATTAGLSKRNLTFSSCALGEEFTCNVGRCIPISKRCNNVRDCSDGSDEEDCTVVDIPQSYDRLEPPQATHGHFLGVHIAIAVENINNIDTKKMMIDTTMKVTMKWRDNRLRFRNLPPDHAKLITSEISKRLWLPSNNIEFKNEIIGQEYLDKSSKVSAWTNSSPLPFDIYSHREELLYTGLDTTLTITLRIRVKTSCTFNFTKFPFDNQKCQLSMNIRDSSHRRVLLVGRENAVTYTGGKVVGQFEVFQISGDDVDTQSRKNFLHNHFKFNIELSRNPGDGLKMIIFPSLILWLLAFLTLRIDVEDLTNRNRTSVTALLVLVTLFGAISTKEDFPQTSGFKYIDIWFLWYMIGTFLIICHHVVLSNISLIELNDTSITKVRPCHAMKNYFPKKKMQCNEKRKEVVNKIVSVLFFLAMIVFNGIYFIIAT